MDTRLAKQDIKPGNIRGRPQQRLVIDGLICTAGIGFFATTSPQGTPSLLLLAGFIAIATIGVALFDLVLYLSGYGERMRPGRRRSAYIIVGVVPAVLLLLQSLGQLSIRDTTVIILVTIIGAFYVSAMRRKQ